MNREPVTEADLHAWLDGALPEGRRAEVLAYLADHPGEAARLDAYRKQQAALHARFDTVLDEPVPERLSMASRSRSIHWQRAAAALAWLAVGASAGWYARAPEPPVPPVARVSAPGLARDAALAHAVYSPEIRHPVEVGVEEEAHLVAWLSKRLGAEIQPPKLAGLGYQLIGGRLLPGGEGPAAQFMYQDAGGQRLTLYVRTDAAENRETAFRFASEGQVRVFYWVDRNFGYALSAEIEREPLLRVAHAVYRELNP